jgi:putative FmdB family regulatory protein
MVRLAPRRRRRVVAGSLADRPTLVVVPFYEYRCGVCDEVFEQRRAMADADVDVRCPRGHVKAKRLLPVLSSLRSGSSAEAMSSPVSSGGGCGSACACH